MNFSCFRNALIKSTEFLSYPFFLVLGTCNYKSRQNSCQFQHNNLFKTHDLLPIRLNYFLKPCNFAKSHVLHLPQNHYITVTEHTSSLLHQKPMMWCHKPIEILATLYQGSPKAPASNKSLHLVGTVVSATGFTEMLSSGPSIQF